MVDGARGRGRRRCSASRPRCSCPAARWPSRSRCASTPTAPAAAPCCGTRPATSSCTRTRRTSGCTACTAGRSATPAALITLADLEEVAEYAAALLIELPQREIGGRLPAWDDLVAQTALARSHGAAVHLDGARLLESLPFYGRTAAEVAALFDSVYVSLYKGLGGIAGCLLAGDEQLVAEAREWRHRHGGTLFELWPYAAAGLAGLRLRGCRGCRRTSSTRGRSRPSCATLDGVQVVPDPPVTTMMHVLPARRGRGAGRADPRGSRPSASCGPGRRRSPPSCRAGGRVELTVGDATMDFDAGRGARAGG